MKNLTSQIKSPLVSELVRAVTRFNIRISTLPPDSYLVGRSLCEVQLELSGKTYRCLAYNEYGDMDRDNLPLQLNMILMELETYQDFNDILDWAWEYGLDASQVRVSELWDCLQKNALEVRQVLGSNILATSSWDLQHGSGDIQGLRDLPLCYARPDLYPFAFEVWIKPHQIFDPCFLLIHVGEFCHVAGPLETQAEGLVSYQEVQEKLQNDGWGLAIDTIYPETEAGIETGQWFEYWINPDPKHPNLFVLGSTPGEPLIVKHLYPSSRVLIEFEDYEEAKFALWKDDARGAVGRVSFDADHSFEP